MPRTAKTLGIQKCMISEKPLRRVRSRRLQVPPAPGSAHLKKWKDGVKMKLNVSAAATASALLWSGAVFTVGIANVVQPRYGREFLRLVASIYPGYKARPELSQVAIGTAYAVVDGAVGGALCAWLYNRFLSECETAGFTGTEQPQVDPVRSTV